MIGHPQSQSLVSRSGTSRNESAVRPFYTSRSHVTQTSHIDEARVALAQVILALAPAPRVQQPIVTITPPTPIARNPHDTLPDVYREIECERVPLPTRGGVFFGRPPMASTLPPTLRGRSRRRGSWRSGLRSRFGSPDRPDEDPPNEGFGLVRWASRHNTREVGLTCKRDSTTAY